MLRRTLILLCIFCCTLAFCDGAAGQSRKLTGDEGKEAEERKKRNDPVTCANDAKVAQFLRSKTENDDYLPYDHSDGGGVPVDLEIWVRDLIQLSTADMTLEIDAYINELWTDKWLKFDTLAPCNNNITIRPGQLPKLWSPRIGFANSKQVVMNEQPLSNQLTLVYSNGTVWNNYRATVKVACPADLHYYPFGTVDCPVVMTSLSYSRGAVRLRWRTDPGVVMLSHTTRLIGYTVLNYSSSSSVVFYPAGDWDELTAQFEFRRTVGWHVLHFYAPTTVLLLANWASVGLGLRAGIGARLLLHGGSIVACMTIHNYATRSIPQVSYFTGVDVWTTMCVLMLLISILEMCILNCVAGCCGGGRRGSSRSSTKCKGCGGGLLDHEYDDCGDYHAGTYPYERFTAEETITARRAAGGGGPAAGYYAHKKRAISANWIADMADKVFGGVILPILYIALNVWYWITYNVS